MPAHASSRLSRSALLAALICFGVSGQAAAAAGRVDFASGGAIVAGRDGQARPLVKGAELDSGDTVRTNDGRAQIRFTDGSYVSLQPNSEFGITEYRYDGKTDGSERGFFALVKGALRTVTGAVGRVNRNAYRVTTPTATVGIRGTGGVIQVLPDGATLVIGTSGIWSLSNPAGTIDVPAGVSGLAPVEPKAPPRETSTQPVADPAPLPPQKKIDVAVSEQVTSDGLPKGLVLATGSGYTSALAFTGLVGTAASTVRTNALTTGTGTSLGNLPNADAVFDSAGQMQKVGLATGGAFGLDTGGSHADFGTDGLLAWGRWVGSVNLNGTLVNYDASQGFHYVIGLPTPMMPTVGTASYTLLGATSPTYVDGSAGPGTFSGSLKVDFGANTVGVDMGVVMGDKRAYGVSGSALITGSQFASSANLPLAVTVGSPTPAQGTACTTCGAELSGFFAGPNAERAGMGYRIMDPSAPTGNTILGAAAFKKQ